MTPSRRHPVSRRCGSYKKLGKRQNVLPSFAFKKEKIRHTTGILSFLFENSANSLYCLPIFLFSYEIPPHLRLYFFSRERAREFSLGRALAAAVGRVRHPHGEEPLPVMRAYTRSLDAHTHPLVPRTPRPMRLLSGAHLDHLPPS